MAKSFTEDITMITGIKPKVVTDVKELKKSAIIAGSIGNNIIIDTLIINKRIDVSDIKERRECYKIQVVEKLLLL